MAQDIAIPQLFLPAGNDNDNVKPGGEVIEQLLNNNKKKGEEVGHSSYCFEKMRHGWVTRGDLSDEEGTITNFLFTFSYCQCFCFHYSYLHHTIY